MSARVLILQPDSKSAPSLVNYFTELDKQVWLATDPVEAKNILKQRSPELVVVDLHLLNNGWPDLVPQIQQKWPQTRLLFTTSYPDPQQEAEAKNKYGVHVFLRAPFTLTGLEQALYDLEHVAPPSDQAEPQANLPRVRVPVKIKITLPYVILALILALGAAYLVSRVVLDTLEERFTNQLIEVGKLASDWMVNEENRLLETLRLVAYTQGLPEAITAQDAERLREIVLPLAINYQEEAIEILDMQGVSLLSLRHRGDGKIEDYEATRGESLFSQWTFVRAVVEQRTDQGRDKFAGVARVPWGDYIYVSGPILDDQGQPVGIILVGKTLATLTRQIRQDTLAHVTLYDLSGEPITSSLLAFDNNEITLEQAEVSEILESQDEATLIRPLQVASINYSEIVGPWELREFLNPLTNARHNNDTGLIGVSLAETFLARPGQITRLQILVLTTISFVLIIILGFYLANRITHPLLKVVAASAEVAQGNLEVEVAAQGNDEVAVLAHSFNKMVTGLREGSVYRDLLGRTVSPEVREQLRQGFASGDVKLEGQEAIATVLMGDIRGFTTLSESESPTTIMSWLNEYFEALVPVITKHGGVISKFEGDSILAFFGVLPQPLPPQESAYQACQTALAILEAVGHLNERRIKRGEPHFTTGIGINTGPVTAGALGSSDRLHYTIIGDTVNTTARLESLTRQFGESSSVVISQHVLFALQDRRHEFELEPMGAHNIKGKVEQLIVYHLHPLRTAVRERR